MADISVQDALRWGWAAPGASNAVWDIEGALATSARLVQLLRDAGVLARLPIHLSALAITTAWIGDFTGAAALIAESDYVAAATGSQLPPYASLRLLALRGREADARAEIASAIEHGWPHAQWAAAVLYNGLARYEEAAAAARQAASNTLDPWLCMWAAPELVEAAARSGGAGLAHEALEQLAGTTQHCGTDWALGIEARCRALLSQGTVADELYRDAIDRLSRTQLRPEVARAHLLYGEWQRRQGQRTDAREQLRAAHDMFAAIGMEAFAERARRELAVTGVTVRRRATEAASVLTAQETHIARLARDGRTNGEIGAQLFLSARTVEWHLRKIFTKLGIGSRRELDAALAQLGRNGPPP